MTISQIREAIEPKINSLICFLVDIKLSKDNDIEIFIEKEEGSVNMEDCVIINDFFISTFDRDKEDYSLTVSSPGLNQSFKVHKQYIKAIGSMVQLSLKGGKRQIGKLLEATDTFITLEYNKTEYPDGEKKRKKIEVKVEEKFYFSDINSVIPHVEI